MNRKPAKQVNRQIRIISEIWRWSSSICWRGTAVPKCAILSKMIRQFNANYFCGPQLDEKINKNWSLAYFDKTDLIKAAGNSFEITLCSPHSVLPQTSMTVPPHFLLLRPSAVLPWRRTGMQRLHAASAAALCNATVTTMTLRVGVGGGQKW